MTCAMRLVSKTLPLLNLAIISDAREPLSFARLGRGSEPRR